MAGKIELGLLPGSTVTGKPSLKTHTEPIATSGFTALSLLKVSVITALPGAQEGVRLILGGGDKLPGCGGTGRTLWYDMVCDPSAAPDAGPNATMFIYPAKGQPPTGVPGCTYKVEWRTRLAC